MKKVFGASLLTIAVLWIGADTTGQDRKTRTTSKAGTIEIVESRDGKFRFNVRDSEGKYLAGSTVGHVTEKEAREAVEELKRVMASAIYVKKKSEGATESRKEKDKND
jgi:uncharacterized protein YegP (UPF0339 family)